MSRTTTRPAPVRRPIARPRSWPRLTLGHLLVATAVAAPPLALIARAAREVDGAPALVLTALFAAGVVFELEVAFWVAFGPAVHPWLTGRRPTPGARAGTGTVAADSAGIRWLDEPGMAGDRGLSGGR